MSEIISLNNSHLSISVHTDATIHFTDRKTGARWSTWPAAYQEKGLAVEDVVWNRSERCWADIYHSAFKAEKIDGGMKVTVVGPGDVVKGMFACLLSLDAEWLVVRIEGIEERLQSLVFPAPIKCASMVIPNDVGQWLHSAPGGMESRLSLQNNGMNMRWIGGLAADQDNGWMTVFEDAFADSGVYRNGLMAAPIWFKSLRKWGPTRSVRYRCTSGGYVGMAKIFRNYALDKKIFRTLKDKIAENPKVEALRGGRIVSFFQCSTRHAENSVKFLSEPAAQDRSGDGTVDVKITHKDAAAIMELAKGWGMKRGLFNLRGTFKGGYDDAHPDIWPPEPALGTVDELRNITSLDGAIITSLHDNYQDMYQRAPSFPDGVIRTLSGDLMHGGFWHGGQCFIICPTRQPGFARRNWENISTLAPRAYFIDTAACVQFYECFHPEHPMTRNEDVQSKLDLMGFFKKQGLVLGSENAADFGMWHLDYLENRHTHKPGVSIPLWPLVFHDAAFYARYGTDGTGGGEPVSQLENWLWGYLCYYPANTLADFKKQENRFKETLALDAFHEKIALAEMTNHKYLTEDKMVEQTEFSTGVSVIANFADEPRTINGKTVKAKDHLVVD